MRRLTIKRMVCEDLGYCCLFAFFTKYRDTQMIADRLGVSTRAVRYHKMACGQGDYSCENLPRCLKSKLPSS